MFPVQRARPGAMSARPSQMPARPRRGARRRRLRGGDRMTDPRLDAPPGLFARMLAGIARRAVRVEGRLPGSEALRRILVVRTDDRVGNALLTIPLGLALRESLPGAQVDLLLAARRAHLAEGLGLGIVPFEKTDAFRHPLRFLRFLRALRARYDVVLDAAHWHAFSLTSALLSRWAARAFVVGSRRGPDRIYSASVDLPSVDAPEAEAKLLLLRGLGLPVPASAPLRTRAGEDLAQWAAGVLGGSAVLLNPGARKADHRWPPDRFAALARGIHAKHGLRSMVTFGPGEEPLARAVVEAARPSAFLAPPTDLPQLAALLRLAALAVVNDTGPMHLAAACGAPTLALLHAPEGARFAHRDPLFAALVWPDVPQALAAASRLLDTAQAAREPPPSSQEHHR
ncbi:MAG: glycosyltransferase family 9 protein [Deltaproteobacteria bacterium]|nr:MAG: glycosyltransferase family 9 protein [Deltaproteobacteria bacterium]